MSKYFAGIRPTSPGWDTFVIRPQTDVCATIHCTVPTVKGYIRLDSEKTDGVLTLQAQIPAGTTAQLSLSYTAGQTVSFDGTVIYRDGRFTGADGLTFAGEEDGALIFSLEASEMRTVLFEATAR